MGSKKLYGHFKQQASDISHKKTWMWPRNRNFKRETESLLIAAQNNAIKANLIKVRIDKTQQKSRCRLCGDRDEVINHIISECSKLAQKEYKIRQDWEGKVIHWELCKKLKFDHANKWYIHNSESLLENEMHKLLWDFEIQTDHLISARQPDLTIINKRKRTSRTVDFAVLVDHWVKFKESKKKNKYINLAWELKKLWNMKVTIIKIVIGALGKVTKGLIWGLEELEIRRWVETSQITAQLRLTRIRRRVLETWRDLLSLKL